MQRHNPPNENPFDVDTPASSSVDAGQLLRRAVLRHPISIMFCVVTGLASGLFVGMIQPNLYESVAKLQVRLGAREQRTAEGAITAEFQRLGSNISIEDVVHVFTDPMLHGRVADIVGVNSVLRPTDATSDDDAATTTPVHWMHQLQTWWNRRTHDQAVGIDDDTPELSEQVARRVLANGVIVQSSNTSSTIVIRFTAQSPNRAREIVQAYLDVFRTRHEEVFEPGSQLAFLLTQLGIAVDEADSLAATFEEQRREHDIFDIDQQITDLAHSAAALEAIAETEAIDLAAATAQLKTLNTSYAELGSTTSSDPTPALVLNTDHATLLVDRRETQRELDDVAARFPAGSVGYEVGTASLTAQLARIEEELAQSEQFIQVGNGAAIIIENRLFYEVMDARFELEQQVGALEARILARGTFLASQRDRLTELLAVEPEYRGLEIELGHRRARVASLRPACERAQLLRDVGSDERLSNLKVIQNPTLPIEKVGPERKKYILLGLILGTALGLSSAIGRLLLDPRIRYVDEIENGLGVAVLGTIPETGRWRRWGPVVRKRARA